MDGLIDIPINFVIKYFLFVLSMQLIKNRYFKDIFTMYDKFKY